MSCVKKEIKAEIERVLEDSIAEELGIEAGDFLLTIDKKPVYDIIDYENRIYKEFLEIEILKTRINEIWEFEIEKDKYEDIGIEFKVPIFDDIKVCRNNCIFCFVAQLPKGLRKSLYIKDEDFRFSFLHGSYTTLSNLEEADLKRIFKQKISPIYVSVHATDSDTRIKLLRNKEAGNIMEKIKLLTDNRIEMHTQAVIVPEINDGKILEKTIEDLFSFYPKVKSLTIVPLGLTKYHKNGLRLLNKEEAYDITRYVMKKSEEIKKKTGTSFVFLADEFFIKSGISIPETEYYEDFEHLENGVGLVRVFLDEAKKFFSKKNRKKKEKKSTIVCGESIYEYMKETFKNEENIEIQKIKNYFFGEMITVTGLITGSDLIENLKNKEIGEELIINKCMTNENKEFLDGMTVEEIENKLGVKVRVVERIKEIYKN